MLSLLPSLLLAAALPPAAAQAVPSYQIPPAVVAEMRTLENRFELALSADCDAERCFSKGCSYVAHSTADRPRSGSLPGLRGEDKGPGSVEAQEYLTQAQCAFAHESDAEAADVQALVRRLQTKLSGGWLVVGVGHQPLLPLPSYLREPPAVEASEPDAVDPTEPAAAARTEWTAAVAGRELWTSLLPHFYWMIGLGLVTLAGSVLIWSWRRVGQASMEEQLLMAQLAAESAAPDEPTPVAIEDTDREAEIGPDDPYSSPYYVAQQVEAWTARLDGADPERPDPELQALIRELLRAGDMPLLAKAALRFPDTFPAAFPTGGDVAPAKLALADFLKTADASALPSDAVFFEALNRHALSATVANQSDARVVRSLREDFGAAGLASLIGALPARSGALLFALAPTSEQYEAVRLLPPAGAAGMADQLLRSDRMAPSEASYLFEVLQAARAGAPVPAAPQAGEVLDRGAAFDAAGALSVLLGALAPEQRAGLFRAALQRFHGSLPAWYRGILVPDMLLALPAESRADLLLEIDVEPLAAWLSLLGDDGRARLLDGAPAALRASVDGASVFPSRERQLALAERGRRDLARGFQGKLARTGVTFEQVVLGQPAGTA